MTYTRSQLHERISDLSGQYRAAQENKRLTSQKRAEDERLADLSRQADEKADGHLLEIAAQINEAKAQYAAAVDEIIEPEKSAESAQIAADFITPDELRARYAGGASPDNPPPIGWQGTGAQTYNSIFTEGADLHSQLLAKAVENMNGAYDEATQ